MGTPITKDGKTMFCTPSNWGACTIIPGGSHARHEPLRCERNSETAMRLADVVYIAKEPNVELVDGRSAQSFSVADREHLSLADRECIKAGYARAALTARIGIIQTVIINEVVAGDLTDSGIGIYAYRPFIVTNGFRIGRTCE